MDYFPKYFLGALQMDRCMKNPDQTHLELLNRVKEAIRNVKNVDFEHDKFEIGP